LIRSIRVIRVPFDPGQLSAPAFGTDAHFVGQRLRPSPVRTFGLVSAHFFLLNPFSWCLLPAAYCRFLPFPDAPAQKNNPLSSPVQETTGRFFGVAFTRGDAPGYTE